MHEIKMEIEKFKEAKKTLEGWLCTELAEGPKDCSLEALGMITDQIKDLSDAAKNCMKAKYYETVIEAMEKGSERLDDSYDDHDRMGYNNYRYASSGRYAPKGSGTRYGYDGGSSNNSGRGNGNSGSDGNSSGSNGSYGYPMYDDVMGYPMYNKMMDMNGMGSEYGRAYDEYKVAKRHYTQTHSDADNKEMNTKIEETASVWLDVIEEIMKDANPEMRKKLKIQTTKLLEQM